MGRLLLCLAILLVPPAVDGLRVPLGGHPRVIMRPSVTPTISSPRLLVATPMPSPFKWLDASFGRKALAAIVQSIIRQLSSVLVATSHKRGTRGRARSWQGTATGANEMNWTTCSRTEGDGKAEEGDFELCSRGLPPKLTGARGGSNVRSSPQRRRKDARWMKTGGRDGWHTVSHAALTRMRKHVFV